MLIAVLCTKTSRISSSRRGRGNAGECGYWGERSPISGYGSRWWCCRLLGTWTRRDSVTQGCVPTLAHQEGRGISRFVWIRADEKLLCPLWTHPAPPTADWCLSLGPKLEEKSSAGRQGGQTCEGAYMRGFSVLQRCVPPACLRARHGLRQ